jgi:hypothetical protein
LKLKVRAADQTFLRLSDQLYQKSTHFLLELIQNADDNDYGSSVPTLNITFSIADRTLRIDCNETGFSKSNTEAICKIGRSTKSGTDKSTRYIGEKGIGFKSVFKIADSVWILSGHYSFKFEKYARLGMIAPIWTTTFPADRKNGYTSMYLQLAEKCDISEIYSDIKALDPRLLIFLHSLRHVNITVIEGNGEIWRSKLGRQDMLPTKEGEKIISLNHNSDFMSYRTTRYPVSSLPPDPKRPGSLESEILLAFPLNGSNEPMIASQNVYAFLPIRDYGFKVSCLVTLRCSSILTCLVLAASRLLINCKPRRH